MEADGVPKITETPIYDNGMYIVQCMFPHIILILYLRNQAYDELTRPRPDSNYWRHHNMQVDFDYGVDSIEMVIINSMAPMESFTAELGRGQSEFPIKNYIGQQARPCLGQAPAGWQLTGRRTLSQPWNEMPGGKSVLLQLSSPIFMFTRFRKSSKKTLKQLRRRWDDCRCEGGRKGGEVFQIGTIDCGTNQFVYEFDNLWGLIVLLLHIC